MDAIFSDSDWDSFSDSSDGQDNLNFPYSNQALDLLNSLEESIEKIDDFLSFERGYVYGDIVCSASDPSGQTGRVVHVDMSVDLESTDGKVIRNVSSLKISKIRSICAGDYVVHQHLLGRVDRVIDSVDIVFDDGMRCNVIAVDQDRIEPISSNPVDDPQFPYYPGQRVRVKLPTVSRQARWLCGTWKASHDEGIVCAVKADLLQVEWLGSFLCRDDTNLFMPPNLVNAENVTVLSCFSHSNWQLGDWCAVPIDGNLLTHVKRGNEFQRKDSTSNPESIFIVSRTRTKVDVLWQDGTRLVGVDSQSLLPVNIADAHAFWPEQFVLIKNGSEDTQALEAKKWGVVLSMDSKEKTVKVAWKNHSSGEANDLGEEIVSAYELIDHPDYSFCLKDIVFRLARDEPEPNFEGKKGSLENAYLPLIGNVVGFRDGTVEVKWATGLTTMVAPHEIFRCDKLEVPSTALVTVEDNIISQQITGHDMQPSDPKGTDLLSNCTVKNKEYQENFWEHIPLSLPRSAIGFLTGLTANLFGFAGSTSDFGSSPSDPVLEDESSCEDQLEKECVETPHSGLEMKTLESEAKSSLNSLLEIEENKDVLSLKEPGDENFKQFDLVNDCSDHHFLDQASNELRQSQFRRSWLKKVQHEWSVLEKNLPDTIYVRAYEERMDLLRAAIVGAPGTPYHYGLFLFDIYLPPEFPNVPPKVHYHSGGLRLNPNLYESGKVCLSLLNTWNGTGSEVWDPHSSTVLQVLVSLQALVLNDRPYFNEAGYDKQVGKAEGEKNSVSYNENAFLLTCKSMMYLLRRSPKNFEALIFEHFGNCYQNILRACKDYMGGALVGFPSGHGIEGEEEKDKGSSTGFKIMLSKLYPKLIEAFEEKGFDCSHFTCP